MRVGHLFVLMSTLSWMPLSSMAEEDVFKCGREITNKPLDASVCQKIVSNSAVQIEGTRVQSNNSVLQTVKPVSAEKAEGVAENVRGQALSSEPPPAQSRQRQARTILEDEWQKLSAKHAELVRIYKQGRPDLMAGEDPEHSAYKQRVEGLHANLQRVERDLQALRRELSRYPFN